MVTNKQFIILNKAFDTQIMAVINTPTKANVKAAAIAIQNYWAAIYTNGSAFSKPTLPCLIDAEIDTPYFTTLYHSSIWPKVNATLLALCK